MFTFWASLIVNKAVPKAGRFLSCSVTVAGARGGASRSTGAPGFIGVGGSSGSAPLW